MSTQESQPEEVNEVTLVGRMSQPAEEQVLPERVRAVEVPGDRGAAAVAGVAGDAWTRWTAWSGRNVRLGRSPSWRTGDLVEVKGSLRRRFFAPAGGGRVSRCEVEVASARLIRRADG